MLSPRKDRNSKETDCISGERDQNVNPKSDFSAVLSVFACFRAGNHQGEKRFFPRICKLMLHNDRGGRSFFISSGVAGERGPFCHLRHSPRFGVMKISFSPSAYRKSRKRGRNSPNQQRDKIESIHLCISWYLLSSGCQSPLSFLFPNLSNPRKVISLPHFFVYAWATFFSA